MALFGTVASSLKVVRPYCVVATTTPTFAYSLVRVPHKCGTAMAVPALGCYGPVIVAAYIHIDEEAHVATHGGLMSVASSSSV